MKNHRDEVSELLNAYCDLQDLLEPMSRTKRKLLVARNLPKATVTAARRVRARRKHALIVAEAHKLLDDFLEIRYPEPK